MRLKDICSINMGQSPDSFSYNKQNEGMPFFQGKADFKKYFPVVTNWCTSPLKKAKSGDLLISVRAPVGDINIANIDCCIGRGLAALSPIENKSMVWYLYYLLTAKSNILQNESTGSTFKAIGRKNLEELEIPTHTLKEQYIIVNNLHKIDTIVDKYEKELDLLDNLNKSRFVEMFHKKQSIKSVNLEEVCSSIVRGPFGSALKKDIFVDKDEQSIKIYEQKHAIRKDCNIGSYYISKDTFEELKRFKCGPGDILMSCSGTIGELYQLPEEAEVGIINQALCKFTPKKEINSEYFLAEMNHIIGHVGTQGSSIKNIVAVSQIKKLQFLLPTDKRQTEYACFVKQVNKSKFAIQKRNKKLEILKKSLMQEYFG